jgi:hypothetical protein
MMTQQISWVDVQKKMSSVFQLLKIFGQQQNLDWSKVAFKRDIYTDTTELEKAIAMLTDVTAVPSSLTKDGQQILAGNNVNVIRMELRHFDETVGALLAMERCDMLLPGLQLKRYVEVWLPKFRKLYVSPHTPWKLALRLVTTIHRLLLVMSDYTLFHLSQEAYRDEVDFLLKMADTIGMETPLGLTSRVLSSLLLFSDIDEQQEAYDIINKCQRILVDRQDAKGYWTDNLMRYATIVSALIRAEKDPLVTPFATLIDQATFTERSAPRQAFQQVSKTKPLPDEL